MNHLSTFAEFDSEVEDYDAITSSSAKSKSKGTKDVRILINNDNIVVGGSPVKKSNGGSGRNPSLSSNNEALLKGKSTTSASSSVVNNRPLNGTYIFIYNLI